LEFTACCLCRCDDCEPVAVGEDFEYRTCPDEFLMVRCRRCGLVYLNPRPAADEARRIYPNTYHAFQFQAKDFGFIYRVRRWLESRRLLSWTRGLPASATILDVGCGDGFHLELLRDFGGKEWTLSGLDLDERAVQAAQARGLNVRQGDLEHSDLAAGSYDLILLIMTIEHVADPRATLAKIAELLAPGGRVIIVTDNTGSPDFSIFGGRHWGGYHFPRHTYLFNKPTMRKLAAAAGLEVERLQTGASPVNWVYSLRNWIDDWKGPRWLLPLLSLKSTLALSVFTAWDMLLSLVGLGAILQVVLRKLTEGGR
jgi:2-polyprenyl-3-methyl-5-hydroxy-6-metoxy-1,4-benzoquinol methylase